MSIANAYVYSLKSQYESILGSDMWDTEMSEGYTYGDWLKDNVVNQALQLAVLGSKADEYKVALSDEDKETAKRIYNRFMASVSDADKEATGFTDEDIQALFERTLLANNVYLAILDTINVELTDEEKEECRKPDGSAYFDFHQTQQRQMKVAAKLKCPRRRKKPTKQNGKLWPRRFFRKRLQGKILRLYLKNTRLKMPDLSLL